MIKLTIIKSDLVVRQLLHYNFINLLLNDDDDS